jgi:hypothetical protein
VPKWQVIEKEEQHHVKRYWGATNGALTVTWVSIQDVCGMTTLNKQLLRQRGIGGESQNLQQQSEQQDEWLDEQQSEQQDEWQDEQQVDSKSHRRRHNMIVRTVRWR